MPLRSVTQIALFSLVLADGAGAAEPADNEAYYGNYHVAENHILDINPFITDAGEQVIFFADYSSGVVGPLSRISGSRFRLGNQPSELTIEFIDENGAQVRGMRLQAENQVAQFAEALPVRREEVSFTGADATLVGTLITPTTPGPHPAIVLLHGSGPLTRHSFGPYPHFFTSLGMAVLVYDKRGTGASTGVRMDASTAIVQRPTRYPDDLVNDALAAHRFLQARQDIDPNRIGFWGSSEGGMLATQAAAKSMDVAFAINSSGFMEPLWQTLEFQVRPTLQAMNVTEDSIRQQSEFVQLWLRVARTGDGWETFLDRERRLIASRGSWFFQTRGRYSSVEQMQFDWDRILSFDPLPQLALVKCPVLGVFGELDTSTPSARAAQNMRRVLSEAQHRDFSTVIFPSASHSLMELPSKKRMAPGVFEALRAWLRDRVLTSPTRALP
jgi:uncharacterized protein